MIWDKPISWSKLKLLLTCPRSLQYELEKRPGTHGPTYWMDLGKWVQYIFQLYFNQKVNLDPRGRTRAVFDKVVSRVVGDRKFAEKTTTYPAGKTDKDFETDVRNDAVQGFELFQKTGLLEKPLRAEQKWWGAFRGIRIFAMVDFDLLTPDGWEIYDGKGYTRMNADPRQLKHYALTLVASGQKVSKSGLLYWKHGLDPVDVSPPALKQFIDTDFAQALPTLQALKRGISEDLPATPGTHCGRCFHRAICPVSEYYKPPLDDLGEKQVTFGE